MSIERNTANWTEVRRRLADIQQRIEQSWEPSPEQCASVLEARARRLACEPDVVKEETGQFDVVEFLLAYEKYGIATSYVREVYPLVELTPLPGAPPFVLGIANVRGQIVSVIDIKRFFDLPDKGLTDLNKLIIVRNSEMEMGILADEVTGVKSIAPRELAPPLPTMTGIRAEYLRGITGERLAVLDIGSILGDPRIIVGKN